MPKRSPQITPNMLLHSNAEITPRNAHPVQRFPILRAPLSVEEITYGELKYNIIPIIHARAGKLLHLKWACLMLRIYSEMKAVSIRTRWQDQQQPSSGYLACSANRACTRMRL